MAITPESPAFPERDAVPGLDQDVHAHADAVAYQHGAMEINEQAATYSLFMSLAKWGSLSVAVVLLFLTLLFRPDGNFIGAAAAAVVLGAGGWFFLRAKPAAH
jgi:hypothetical protein